MQTFYSPQSLHYRGQTALEIAPHVRLAFSPLEFRFIHDPRLNLVIAPWHPSLNLEKKLKELSFESLPELNLTFSKLKPFPIESVLHPLIKDVLIEFMPSVLAFADLSLENRLKITFSKAADQPCPLFHTDKISFRLICTLVGPGTEWVKNDDVNRNALGKASNRNIVKADALVQCLKPYQIGIMKGEKSFLNNKKGLVHRSPPLKNGAFRWYMKIDFPR